MIGARLTNDPRAATTSCTAMLGPVSVEAFRMPASRPMPRPLLLVGRKLRAALVIREGAARRKGATGGQIVQRRYHAGNFLQPLDRIGGSSAHDLQTRDRCQETMGIRMERLPKPGADFVLFHLLAGIHDDDALRGL